LSLRLQMFKVTLVEVHNTNSTPFGPQVASLRLVLHTSTSHNCILPLCSFYFCTTNTHKLLITPIKEDLFQIDRNKGWIPKAHMSFYFLTFHVWWLRRIDYSTIMFGILMDFMLYVGSNHTNKCNQCLIFHVLV